MIRDTERSTPPPPKGRRHRRTLARARDLVVSLDTWLAANPDAQPTTRLHGPFARGARGRLHTVVDVSEVMARWLGAASPPGADSSALLLAAPAMDAAGVASGHDRSDQPTWLRRLAAANPLASLRGTLTAPHATADLLAWHALATLTSDWFDDLLDVSAWALAGMPAEVIAMLPPTAGADPSVVDWRRAVSLEAWVSGARSIEQRRPEVVTPDQRARLWACVRHLDEPWGPSPGTSAPRRLRPPLGLAVRAAVDGAATRMDVLDVLVGDPPDGASSPGRPDVVASMWGEEVSLVTYPWLADLVALVDDRRLAAVTDALAPGALLAAPGHLDEAQRAVALAAALASRRPGSDERAHVRWILRRRRPAPDADATPFCEALREVGVARAGIIEMALVAPHWAPWAEAALGVDGLGEAAWWLHAHIRTSNGIPDPDPPDPTWEAAIAARSDLTDAQRRAGQIDTAWFARVSAAVGPSLLDEITALAHRSAEGPVGLRRTRLAIAALRGHVTSDELITRMQDDRDQLAVAVLGAAPLAGRATTRRTEVARRAQLLEAWQRGSRGGPQRRTSETAAVEAAMANLARTSGYADPRRLAWSLEAAELADLAAGPVTADENDLEVTLRIDAGVVTVEARRKGRRLKTVPRAAKAAAGIAPLLERAERLRDRSAGVGAGLEATALRGDRMDPAEMRTLLTHPLIAPALQRCVLVDDDGGLHRIAADGGTVGPDGGGRSLPARSAVRIAHPVDLHRAGELDAWHQSLLSAESAQPFHQVDRVLHLVGDDERGAPSCTRRRGLRLDHSTAAGILSARGWVLGNEGQAVRRSPRSDSGDTVVVLQVREGLVPVEPGGQLTVIDLRFRSPGSSVPLVLGDVDPVVYSEALRDLDLLAARAPAA